jgi:hypothetical protein
MTAPVLLTDLTHAEPLRRGHRSAATLLALDKRDELLREAARFFPGCSDREIARRLRAALARYRAGRFRRDRCAASCPHAAGKLTALLWRLLKTWDAIPSERLIRSALSRTDSNSSIE